MYVRIFSVHSVGEIAIFRTTHLMFLRGPSKNYEEIAHATKITTNMFYLHGSSEVITPHSYGMSEKILIVTEE